MAWSNEDINELFSKCKNKAMVSKEFREKILANPKETVEGMAGEKFPDDFKIQVIEGDPTASMAFILPPMAETELSDDDLENVAGGMCAQDNSTCLGNACGGNR